MAETLQSHLKRLGLDTPPAPRNEFDLLTGEFVYDEIRKVWIGPAPEGDAPLAVGYRRVRMVEVPDGEGE